MKVRNKAYVIASLDIRLVLGKAYLRARRVD